MAHYSQSFNRFISHVVLLLMEMEGENSDGLMPICTSIQETFFVSPTRALTITVILKPLIIDIATMVTISLFLSPFLSLRLHLNDTTYFITYFIPWLLFNLTFSEFWKLQQHPLAKFTSNSINPTRLYLCLCSAFETLLLSFNVICGLALWSRTHLLIGVASQRLR